MNCSFEEKVSMLIDGELSDSESLRVRAHIAGCAECLETEKDFLFFRQQLRESASEFVGEKMTTPQIFPVKKKSFWRKGISIPIPVFAIFILILCGLSFWLIASRFGQSGETAVENSVKNLPAKIDKTSGEISIAQYDNGGRAEIYVVPRVGNEVRK